MTAEALAGSEVEPGDGWPHDLMLRDLTARPAMGASEFATTVVRRYVESYQRTGQEAKRPTFHLGRSPGGQLRGGRSARSEPRRVSGGGAFMVAHRFVAVVGARVLPEAWAPQVAAVVGFFLEPGRGVAPAARRARSSARSRRWWPRARRPARVR